MKLPLLSVVIGGVLTSLGGWPVITAILVIAIIAFIAGFFVLRGNKNKSKKTSATGSADWQRQAQPGAANAAWNQQAAPGAQQGAWGQQGQPAAWGAPNTGAPAQPGAANPWGQPQAQQPANPWGQPAPAQQAANPWGQPAPDAAQQAANPWGQPAPAQQAANPWGQPAPAQQAANPWGQPAPAQQAANPWGQPAPAQQAANPWEAAPAPAAQQDGWGQPQAAQGQSWGGQNNSAPLQGAPGQYAAANSGPGWGQPAPAADPWGTPAQQAAPPASPFPSAAPVAGWQQNSFSPESDKTMLRSNSGPAGVGYVRVDEGKEPGRIYEVRKESLSIGRSRESDIFLEDLAVSRLHATIVNMNNGTYILKDEGSANGTKVNGQVLNKFQTYPLQEGDRVQLGQTVLVFGKK